MEEIRKIMENKKEKNGLLPVFLNKTYIRMAFKTISIT
jgi:hypothetical protein